MSHKRAAVSLQSLDELLDYLRVRIRDLIASVKVDKKGDAPTQGWSIVGLEQFVGLNVLCDSQTRQQTCQQVLAVRDQGRPA